LPKGGDYANSHLSGCHITQQPLGSPKGRARDACGGALSDKLQFASHKNAKSAGGEPADFATRKEEEMKKMNCIVYILQCKYEERKCKNIKKV